MTSPIQAQCPKCQKRLEETANFCPSCGEDLRGLTPTADTLSGSWVGRVIDDRYRLLEKLGEGGMGAVFKVEHVRMGKICALKLLRPEVALDKKMKQRFHQEARVVSKLSHPNTIQVFDFGELEDGSLYIAMEFLPGRDLMWTLRTHGPFSEERAISIGIQVLSSLSEAHELGIVHRDIKPANVMLIRRKDGGDTVKVLDFGIAKLNDSEARKHITGVADFVGTPAYMSPEQGKGEELDARSDLYSVASMLFELVSGRGVFDGPTPMSIVTKHMTEPPPRFAQVAPDRLISPAFEAVIRKALAKERSDRFPNADAMRKALEQVRRDIAGNLADFTPLSVFDTGDLAGREDFDRFESRLRRQRILLPVLTLLLLGAGGGAAAWEFFLKPKPQVLHSAEVEPNEDPSHATRIALGIPVSGKMGVPTSADSSDVDVYELELPHEGAVSIELSGVPDLNLVLSAHQDEDAIPVKGAGPGVRELRSLVTLDDGRVGQGERVDGLRVSAGKLYVRIQERAHASEPPDRPPRSNLNTPYSLTVRMAGSEDERLEDEPRNDTVDTAEAVPMSRAVHAFTGMAIPLEKTTFDHGASAVDIFKVTAGPGDGRVFAVVAPPRQGRLTVMDARSPSDAKTTDDGPLVLPLREGRAGYAVRVQPYWPEASGRVANPIELLKDTTPAGSDYYVAFFSESPDGLEGVCDLLQALEQHGRLEQAQKVVDDVRRELRGSTNLASFNARASQVLAGDLIR